MAPHNEAQFERNEVGLEKQRALTEVAIAARSCEDETAAKMSVLEEVSRIKLVHIAEQLGIELERTMNGAPQQTRQEIIDAILEHSCTVTDITFHVY